MWIRRYTIGKDENGLPIKTVVNIAHIGEWTYVGKNMGERRITATVNSPVTIDFLIDDFIEIEIGHGVDMRVFGLEQENYSIKERFYIYSIPSVKKIASPGSAGNAFEYTLTFEPRQRELAHVMMRDTLEFEQSSNYLYSGFGDFVFYGGAKTMAMRIDNVLRKYLDDRRADDADFDSSFTEGDTYNGYWNIMCSDAVDETKNTLLEKFQYTFSNNNVMEALMMLTKEDNVNTNFFVIGRNIFIGYKMNIVKALDNDKNVTDNPYIFQYGKTSHYKPGYGKGGLFSITKTINDNVPVNKLYVYGGNRNLNRFYCADRIKTGRYVDKLMLPSFSEDGRTDYILSQRGIKKYGVHEGVKTFENIYPSLRYINHETLEGIKYVIKIMGSGAEDDPDVDGFSTITDDGNNAPLARIQCYRVEETINTEGKKINTLVKSWPDRPIAVFIHALNVDSKRVMCVLYTSESEQLQHDPKMPTDKNGNSIVGSCFCVHDNGFPNLHDIELTNRTDWFENINNTSKSDDEVREIVLNQINYTDTFWVSDVYYFESYDQTNFSRNGVSAYCYARYPKTDYSAVNSVIAVGRIKDVDTWMSVNTENMQSEFDLYIGDIGFKINEQTPFGDNVWLIDGTFTISILDGKLGGTEFDVSCKNGSEIDENVVPAYKTDGSYNELFVEGADDKDIAQAALAKGAMWRIRCKRDESKFDSYGIVLPTKNLNLSEGDQFIFLNIHMPDIYIEAAENKMYNEAIKYLNENDHDDVQYAVESDKIRMQQLPELALQLREGMRVRLKDDDIYISTDNEEQTLVDASATGTVREMVFEPTTLDSYYPVSNNSETNGRSIVIMDDTKDSSGNRIYKTGTAYIPYESREITDLVLTYESYYTVVFKQYTYKGRVKLNIISQHAVADRSNYFGNGNTALCTQLRFVFDVENSFTIIESETGKITKDNVYQFGYNKEIYVDFGYPFGVLTENAIDTLVDCVENHVVSDFSGDEVIVYDRKTSIQFRGSKYYTVQVELPKNGEGGEAEGTPGGLRYADTISYLKYKFAIVSNSNKAYIPECEETILFANDAIVRKMYRFLLPDNFNDYQSNYIGFYVTRDGVNSFAQFKVMSVVESNTDGAGNMLPYVDLTIDQLTIKYISSSDNRIRKEDENEYVYREIQMTLKEQKVASSWATLRNDVRNAQVVAEQANAVSGNSAIEARRRFSDLRTLRESIFDPDGKCKDTFLQTMMMQVGADSMNYSLDNTYVHTDSMNNIVIGDHNDDSQFGIQIGADVLHHYVFTDGSQGGKWAISRMDSMKIIDMDAVNYIYLKCEKNGSNGEWHISESQLSADSGGDYYYFHYGIVYDMGDGVRIIETRGNAYMYGDNIICGRISTIDGGSYFDLNRNVLKLGDGLEYKNGVLNVGSSLKSDKIGMIITNVLKLLESGVNKAGLSGVENDGVLLWAGGTYEEAKTASGSESYESQEGKPIAVLLKPDGTGKIGIFRINEDTISVVVNDNERILITSGELENNLPESVSYNLKYPSSGTDVFVGLQGSTFKFFDTTAAVRPKKGTLMVQRYRLNISELYAEKNGAQVAKSVTIQYALVNTTNNSIIGEICSATITTDATNKNSLSLFENKKTIFDVPENTPLKLCLHVVSDSDVIVRFNYSIKSEGSFAEEYVPKTIIASDGLASIADANHYFRVKNNKNGQMVQFKGIGFAPDVLDYGEGSIYRDEEGIIRCKTQQF